MKKIIDWTIPHSTIIYEIIALVATCILILLMFPNNDHGNKYSYSVGGFWSENDLVAPYDFAILKTQEEIDQETALAKSRSLLYFSPDSSARSQAFRAMEGCQMTRADKQLAKSLLERIYRKGYLETPTDFSDELTQHTIVVLDGNIGQEHASTDFVTAEDIYPMLTTIMDSTSRCEWMEKVLIDSILVPSIRYDAMRTQLELDSRLSQTVYSADMVMAGSLIVAKGQYITDEIAQVITSLEKEDSERFDQHYNAFNHNLGQFLLCIIAFVALYMFMKNNSPDILDDVSKVNMVFLIVLFMAACTAVIVRIDPAWVLLVPLCIAPNMMRVFFDMRVALYIHLTIVIILGSLVPNSFEFIFYQLITGIMSIITVRDFSNRSNFFKVSGVIFLTYSLIYTAGILSQNTSWSSLDPTRYLMFFFNALFTLLSYPLIYFFERLFGITTDLTLLELARENNPLLRRMAKEADGTLAHCQNVATISSDVIDGLGKGNPLLARVGALYHDIGKLNHPLYFTENQKDNYNPHDELDYEDSSMYIRRHVTDGIEMAKEYGLPREVVDFIRSHHGTTRTGYFYAKWLEAHPGEICDEEAFQYKGTCPSSIEMAVVMIADSVEAASRSLKNPDKESISKLVDNIIDGKIREDQFSNCEITMKDLTKIRELLKQKLLSTTHVRISYPTIKR